MKKKAKKKVNRTISLRPDQDEFLRAHKDEINFSDNVRDMVDDLMKEWDDDNEPYTGNPEDYVPLEGSKME